jgi:hypothetical protein
MSRYYHNCFDHITDPVQRNSVRQQWYQLLYGGLSVADVRMLLDKYLDFRFAISRWIPCQPANLGFSYDTMDILKEFVATLPEFKDVFDKYVSELVSLGDLEHKLEKLAAIFPQVKQVTEQSIKRIKEDKEKRRRDDELRMMLEQKN